MLVLSSTDALVASAELEFIFPELAKSEDERARKLLIWQVHRNIEDETNDLAQSVYDGIKGHDPDLEESIEDWKRCLAYLEKQKEPVPIPDKFSGLKSLMLQYLQSAANRKDDSEIESDTDLWGRKILDYVWKYSDKQKEQKPAEWNKDIIQKAVKEVGLTQHQINWFKTNVFPPKQEWGENEAYGKSDAEFEMAHKGFKAGAEWAMQQLKGKEGR